MWSATFARAALTLRAVLTLVVCPVLTASCLSAEPPRDEARVATAAATQRASPIRIIDEARQSPPMRLWVVKVDLNDPRVKLRVLAGGPDPDGQGKWTTVLQTVPDIARRERVDLAVNASFFGTDNAPPYQKGYLKDKPAAAVGRTTVDGTDWTPMDKPDWPVLFVDPAGKVQIGESAAAPDESPEVVAGNCFILREGKDVTPKEGMMAQRHPRTAVGINADGSELTLLIVDGRQLASVGMTGVEMAAEFIRLGCVTAINLDGGGSTQLVQKRSDGTYAVVNKPSDPNLRPVANAVGIEVRE